MLFQISWPDQSIKVFHPQLQYSKNEVNSYKLIGQGASNLAFELFDSKGQSMNLVLKVHQSIHQTFKITGLITDNALRSVRLFNEINSLSISNNLIHKAFCVRLSIIDEQNSTVQQQIVAWIAPKIEGQELNPRELTEYMQRVFETTGRVITDAPIKNNILKTANGDIICLDVGQAMFLNSSGQTEKIQQSSSVENEFFRSQRLPSIGSLYHLNQKTDQSYSNYWKKKYNCFLLFPDSDYYESFNWIAQKLDDLKSKYSLSHDSQEYIKSLQQIVEGQVSRKRLTRLGVEFGEEHQADFEVYALALIRHEPPYFDMIPKFCDLFEKALYSNLSQGMSVSKKRERNCLFFSKKRQRENPMIFPEEAFEQKKFLGQKS